MATESKTTKKTSSATSSKATTKARYNEGIGRRKTASARVRLTPAKETTVVINDKKIEDYFKHQSDINEVMSVFTKSKELGITDYTVTVKVSGSGLSAQSDAIKLGIARALLLESEDRRGILKKSGFLKRDPRAVERKKFGLRKARRAPQWSKR